MNVLDENIVFGQRRQLQLWKIHLRQIGVELGQAGMKDFNEVIPLLHTLKRPTFFTRDHDYYNPDLRHPVYCLALLDVAFDEAAEYTRRLLRHKDFRTQAQRMGKVIRVRHSGISYWQLKREAERALSW